MAEVHQTDEFRTWLRRLKDDNAVARIVARIRRMEQGNFGDARSVGAGVMELRIEVAILLCAGDKRTQRNDIRRAHAMAREIAERR